jgi:hypothetical protein
MSNRRHWLNRCSFLISSQPITLSNCAAQRPCVTVYNLLSENPHVRRRKKNQNPPVARGFFLIFLPIPFVLFHFSLLLGLGYVFPLTHISLSLPYDRWGNHLCPRANKKTRSVKKEMEDEIWKFEKRKTDWFDIPNENNGLCAHSLEFLFFPFPSVWPDLFFFPFLFLCGASRIRYIFI